MRADRPGSEALVVGDVEYDPARHEARRGDRVVHLTSLESSILGVLMQQPECFISSKALGRAVWGDDLNRAGSIRVHIHQLRRKLEAEGAVIDNRKGLGYRVVTP